MRIVIGNKEINIETATTALEQIIGLSGRDNLSEDNGLLFIYPRRPVTHNFNTIKMKFSIDIICIANDRIIFIKEKVPIGLSNILLPSCHFILEVNGGVAEENKWKIGTSVEGLTS